MKVPLSYTSRMNNRSGKVITIFLVIFAILLVSTAAIAIFLFQKEIERRKSAEVLLVQVQANQANLEKDLKTALEQVALLDAKNKEADEKINSLLDEVEFEKGVREELKVETQSLRDSLQKEAQNKEAASEELMAKLEQSQTRAQEFESRLSKETDRAKELDSLAVQLQERIGQLETQLGVGPAGREQIHLEKIVVSPGSKTEKSAKGEGRVLTVDAENEFVIVNLGQKDGIAEGAVLSVLRGEEYLGDVQVTRVQPEMSAADFIPPLASQSVSKNDRVVKKQ